MNCKGSEDEEKEEKERWETTENEKMSSLTSGSQSYWAFLQNFFGSRLH